MLIALTRAVSPRLAECELSFREREPIDVALAAEQHAEYERQLEVHGCRVVRVTAAPEMPDGVFVEDVAVVLHEIAIVTRPGAESRREETESIARALQPYRPIRHMSEPSTLDGGDVLRAGPTLFVGRSQRTNNRGIAELRDLVREHGYAVVPTAFRDCLHLKSAVTQIAADTVLLNPNWVDPRQFAGLDTIAVDPQEPHAANILRIGETLFIPAEFPRTQRLLEDRGYRVEAIDVSELQKAEAGLTCCSVIFRV